MNRIWINYIEKSHLRQKYALASIIIIIEYVLSVYHFALFFISL